MGAAVEDRRSATGIDSIGHGPRLRSRLNALAAPPTGKLPASRRDTRYARLKPLAGLKYNEAEVRPASAVFRYPSLTEPKAAVHGTPQG